MSDTLSVIDLLEKGINIIEKEIQLYSYLQNNTQKSSLKAIFNSLILSENNQIKILKNLTAKLDQIIINYPPDWKNKIQNVHAITDFELPGDTKEGKLLSRELRDEIASIQIAITFKKDNILYFMEFIELIEDQYVRDMFRKVIQQEKKHISTLLEAKMN